MENAVKRRRYATGPPRPQYLSSVDADRATMMILALSAEVSALRERLDTHERLADAGQLPALASVEAYQAPDAVEATRAAARRALIDRVMRVLLEPDPAAITGAAPSVPPSGAAPEG
jgi:hypothetical protein